MKYNYSFKSEKENIAKVVGRDLDLSTKQAIEICSFIKNKNLAKVKAQLENTKNKKLAIPFKRFTEGAGHKKGRGIAGGKYPLNSANKFLMLLKSLEANAQNKGLGTDLKIIHACAHKASTPLRYGRKRRISMKRTHVEIVAKEIESVKREKEGKKKEVKETPKPTVKEVKEDKVSKDKMNKVQVKEEKKEKKVKKVEAAK